MFEDALASWRSLRTRYRLPLTLGTNLRFATRHPNSPDNSTKTSRGNRTSTTFAALLVALVFGLAFETQAQTTVVSNTGQTTSDERAIGPVSSFQFAAAQKFTTGTRTGGYTLAAIDVDIDLVGSTVSPIVVIYSATSGGAPGNSVHVLTNPGTVAVGINTFTAPANAALAKETDYFVLFASETGANDGYQLHQTSSDNEDTGAATGWSIANTLRHRTSDGGSWQSHNDSLKIAVKVEGVPGAPENLSATAVNKTQNRLTWNAPSNTGGTGVTVTGYRIEYSAPDHLPNNPTTIWADLVADTSSATTSYDHDHEFAPGVRLNYRVSAINSYGTGTASNESDATAPSTDTAGNGAPDRTGITVNGRRVEISFNENLDASQTPIDASFTLRVNGIIKRVEDGSLDIEDDTLILLLRQEDAANPGDDFRIGYNPPTELVADAVVPLASFALQDIEGNVVGRWTYRSATNETPNVTLSFDKDTKGAGIDWVDFYPVHEGGTAILKMRLNTAPNREVSVPLTWTTPSGREAVVTADYQTVALTETEFSDCAGTSPPATCPTISAGGLTTVSFADDATHMYLLVQAVDDSDDEGLEAVEVALGATLPTGVTAGTPASAEITIIDNDGDEVRVAPTAIHMSEGGAAADYTVSLETAPTGNVTVTVGGLSGEVTVNPSTLTFTTSNWNTAQTVSVTAVDDTDSEGEHTVALTHAVSGYGSNVTKAADVRVWISDNDGLSVSNAKAYEGTDTSLDFTVTLDRPSGVTGTVTVAYATEDGTAKAGDDYTATSGTLTFTGTDAEKTVSVPLIDDMEEDGGEWMALVLSDPTGGVAIGDARGIGTIDNSESETVTETVANTPATGAPTISGTLQVEQTLSASTSNIDDADGLENVSFEYQWIRSGTDISGATASTYELVDADAGATIAVRVSFTDDNNNAESLTSAATEIVAARPVPLTASFSGVPAEHDGTNEFTFALTFSEEPKVSFRVLRDQALSATGGTVKRSRRQQQGSNLVWTVHVQPSGHGNVTVRLSSSVACGTYGSICTGDGRSLSNEPTTTILGPPGLGVADARTNEGSNVSLQFTVSLDRVASTTVTVDYATADGSAQAGLDYTSTSGSLTFGIGETSKTVSVTLLDDDVDEGQETFTLQLSNASGAHIADNEATGTIVNSDPLPKAWLVRFGRTTTDHVVDAITDRLKRTGDDSHVNIGESFLPVRPLSDVPKQTPAANNVSGLTGGGSYYIGNTHPGLATRMSVDGFSHLSEDPWSANGYSNSRSGLGTSPNPTQQLVLRNLLQQTSFQTSTTDPDRGRRLTAWGQAATTRFDGVAEGASLNGDVATYMLGVDAHMGRWLTGATLAHSLGAGSFSGGTGTGNLDTKLTSLHPYARYKAGERLSAWGIAGFGIGDLSLSSSADDHWRTDTTMHMGAAGVRSVLVHHTSGLEIAAHADTRLTDIASNGVRSTHGNLAATTGKTNRLRLMFEGSRPFAVDRHRLFTPNLELGVRRDGGDAETGTGVELGGTLTYTDATRGLSVETAARTLIAHEDEAYQEWGASATVRLDPGSTGRGLSLSVRPAWGADAMGGAERLWSLRDPRELASAYTMDTDMRLTAEVSYGFPAFQHKGSMTPYVNMRSVTSDRDWRTGVRWELDSRLELKFEVTQHQSNRDAKNGIRLHGTWRFASLSSSN